MASRHFSKSAADDRPAIVRPASRGFSLVEVMVAFVLLAFVLTAGTTMFTWQRTRLRHQTLWHHAIDAVEYEAETHRAISPSGLGPGEGLPFLTWIEPDKMPVSIAFLPNPVARREIVAQSDPNLLLVSLSLSWGTPDHRITYQETFLLAK